MMQYGRMLFCCAVLLFGWATAVNAEPSIAWTMDELIAATGDGGDQCRAVVLARETGQADVVWRHYPSGSHYYTQFLNGVKVIDTELVTTGNTFGQLGINRRYDGKLRVGIRIAHSGQNFREYTRNSVNNWTSSGPGEPATINAPYMHMGGYDLDPCTGLGAFMVWGLDNKIQYYKETADDVWSSAIDVQVADDFWYSGFCDFLITPEGRHLGAYKMITAPERGVHAGEIDTVNGGPLTSIIPDSLGHAWSCQSMTVADDGTIYHFDMRNAAAPKVQVSKSEDNGATWALLGAPASTYRALAQGYDVEIAVTPDESQLAILALGSGATDYTTTLHISEPNDAMGQPLGVEWYTDPCWLAGAADLAYGDLAYDPAGNLYVVYGKVAGEGLGLRILSNAPVLVDADVDNDGDVDFDDWVLLASNWLESSGEAPCDPLLAGSIDNDCDVDLHDFALLTEHWTGPFSNEQGTFTLVSGGANPANIVVGSADPTILKAAEDLAEKLQAISGATFTITPSSNGKSGIVLGEPGDFDYLAPNAAVFGDGPDPNFASEPFLREQYRIYSTDDAVCLIGKTPLAVQHAVWDLLYRLGHRQYFPRSTWEHVPSNDTLSIDIDVEEVPSYRARQIWYNDASTGPYPEWDCHSAWLEWGARNRMANGFGLNSSHSYDSIALYNAAEFAAHPEYMALVGGVRTSGTNAKFCVDNQGLKDLIAAYTVDQFDGNPDADSISRDPSDGGGWCECDGDNPDGTDSNCQANYPHITDSALTVANISAEAMIDAGYTDKYIGMLGYNYHSDPPVDCNVHPNVLISIALGFLSGNFTVDELLTGWQEKGATLGIYDYFSVYQWDLSKPRIAVAAYPYDLAGKIAKHYGMNARFHSAESGDSWGPHGLGFYIANRVLWDVGEADDVATTIDEFLTNMFGPAAAEMANFYDLINVDKEWRSNENLVGSMYKYLDDAVTAADGCDVILDRLYDLVKYTHYVELRANYETDTSQANKEALLRWVYRIRMTDMVHALRIWHVFGYFSEALYEPDYYLKDGNDIDETEALAVLAAGRSTFGDPCVPYPYFKDDFVVYSEDLAPAAEPLGLSHPVEEGFYPTNSQNDHHYWLWVDPCDPWQTTITFDGRTHVIGGKNPFVEVSIYHGDHGDEPVDAGAWPADGSWHRITLNTPYKGLHRAYVDDGGNNQSGVDWDPDPCTVSDTALATAPALYEVDNWSGLFRYWAGQWKLFFYVPVGTETVGFWANSPVGNVRDNNNNIVGEWVDGDPTEWYEIAVPAGQDGKVWYVTSYRGARVLTTVPSYYAKTVDDLLLPREVVYGVSPGQATNPSPGNGDPGVALDGDLSWTVGEATATQKLYLDTVNPPVALVADLSGSNSSYDPGTLLPGTPYYWRLDASNVNGQTAGTVWSFTTE